jgi:7 transmembrane sweet-taste receptor of 3 GCPR
MHLYSISSINSVAIMIICITVLILWTVIDPWSWERVVMVEIPAETYGQCQSRHFWAWFGPLISLLFFAETLTMYFAWKTNDLPDDFRDSGAVLYASFAQMQSWAFGVPMLAVLGSTSAEATYFGRICLIWIFAVSSVVVVVGPKLAKAIQVRRNPNFGQRDRVRVSGLQTLVVSLPEVKKGQNSKKSEVSNCATIY